MANGEVGLKSTMQADQALVGLLFWQYQENNLCHIIYFTFLTEKKTKQNIGLSHPSVFFYRHIEGINMIFFQHLSSLRMLFIHKQKTINPYKKHKLLKFTLQGCK